MKRVIAFLFVLVSTAPGAAAEIGLVEDFALAPDRARVLEQLIPGTRDYYYYSCLHYQNTGELDKVDDLLEQWIKRHKRRGRVREIENRQALLRYSDSPENTLDFLRRRLGLRFEHQPEVVGEGPKLPTTLEPALISRERLTRLALERHRGTLAGFEDRALEWTSQLSLSADQRRHLLARLQRPDVPNLARLVVDDLNTRQSRGFGSHPIHERLLLDQLNECLRLKPDLRNGTRFVSVYLSKLWPGADVDWRHDSGARQMYLDRLWRFASTLSGVHTSLKAHVLYHRLAHDRALGVHDKERFMNYLELPRRVSYIEPRFLRRSGNKEHMANLKADFSRVTQLPLVGNDEPLVRAYFQHLFVGEDSWQPYADFVRDGYLKSRFAETKILSGIGDMESWYSLLSPEEYQALKERVDIDFSATNRTVFSPEEQVSLDVYIKNVRHLIVKVFEINSSNYYRSFQREVDTAIDLDGLVANQEQTYTYEEPDLRRVRRHFEFPRLKPRGVYVIDFIGNGKSSRALVRRGQLRFLMRQSVAGHVFTVLDEKNRRLPDAGMWIGGQRYIPSDDGTIAVPYSNQPGRRPIVLEHDGFASLRFFQHNEERYGLTVGIHCEREALLAGKRALVVVRPSLTLNDTLVTLSVLDNVTLSVTTTDLEGVHTTNEVKDFEIYEDKESTYEFRVPANLQRLSVRLQATVKSLSRDEEIELTGARDFALNGIDSTEKIEDLHLAHDMGRYVLDLLGKSGEVISKRPVKINVKHRDFRDVVQVDLRSDSAGRLDLGQLEDIEWLAVHGPNGVRHRWQLPEDRASLPAALHARAGEVVLVPFMGSSARPSRADVSLLELRGETFVNDRFGALDLDDGFLRIKGLDPGDYELMLKRSGVSIPVRITAGEVREKHVLSSHRQLQIKYDMPVQISEVAAKGDEVSIRLRNATKFTRVHVVATRFLPEYKLYDDLDSVPPVAPVRTVVSPPETLYVVGRDIGEEYRYVLERKYAKKFPGVMLERPNLLLNPWAIRDTSTGERLARAGEAFEAKSSEDPVDPSAEIGLGAEGQALRHTGLSSVDFLAAGAVFQTNLRPDNDGVVRLKRQDLGTGQQLHVVAVDPEQLVYRHITIGHTSSEFSDRRLQAALDSERHFTEQKSVSVIKKGEQFVLDDIATSEFEVYDNLERIYAFFLTLTGDANLRAFRFAIEWPKLTPEEKRGRYSEFACHELNFFLFKKDPEFFDEVVKPHLENKYHRTFLDDWLLDKDLAPYLEPWAYVRLNVVERILLAQRIEGESPFTRRHVEDAFDIAPIDQDRLNHLFRTALRGRALEVGDAFGVAGKLEEIRGSEQRKAKFKSLRQRRSVKALGAQKAVASGKRSRRSAENMPEDSAPEEPVMTAAPEGAAVEDKDDDDVYFGFQDDTAKRGEVRQLYRKVDRTREWVENNYYHLPIEQQGAELITVNAFWLDFARFDGAGPFFSSHLAESARNFPEMMFAISVLDLPFQASEHKSEISDRGLKIDAASPLVVYHKEIRPAEAAAPEAPILVSQNFYRHGERYRQVGNERVDNYVSGEFLVHSVYGCHVVVTNPTSSRQKLNVLLQIPEGSIAVLKGRATRSIDLVLEPYRTWTHDHFFYFPSTGSYEHFPVHVAKAEKLVASAQAAVFTVVAKPSSVERDSWDFVSQLGTPEEVVRFLTERNLARVDLSRIAWRMRDRALFQTVIDLLGKRHVYDHTLWSYGVFHDVQAVTREYLRHSDGFVRQCGDALASPLLVVDPIERRSYQHMEYQPLVNARAHRLGRRREILNDRFYSQYLRLAKILTYRPDLDADDLMSVTYYLLLQDRVDEALTYFDRVRPQQLASKLQYDYFSAYLALFKENVRQAREVASGYENYPIVRWQQFFTAVTSQVDEIEGADPIVVDPEDREQKQTRMAAMEPSFDFAIEGKRVLMTYSNIEKCQVNYYRMDLELLFSRNPFVRQYAEQFAFVRPNMSGELSLESPGPEQAFDIPERFHNTNLLVEIVSGGVKKAHPYFANALTLNVAESYAQLRVAARDASRGLPRAYVKVYVRLHNGGVRFYKDGYTDLRGRFDYGSLSTNEIERVQSFSILVMSEKHGALVREVRPPQM